MVRGVAECITALKTGAIKSMLLGNRGIQRETLYSGNGSPTCSPRDNCSYRGRHPASASGGSARDVQGYWLPRDARGDTFAPLPLHPIRALTVAALVGTSGYVYFIKRTISNTEKSIFCWYSIVPGPAANRYTWWSTTCSDAARCTWVTSPTSMDRHCDRFCSTFSANSGVPTENWGSLSYRKDRLWRDFFYTFYIRTK